MKHTNYISLEFMTRSVNEAFARTAVACFAAQMDPTLDELGDIKTAVSEAVTNAIVHGYREKEGIVRVEACYDDERKLTVTVTDTGCGIPDIPRAMTPFFTTQPEKERSGMGFAVMQTFMDDVQVVSQPGCGTKVTLVKTVAAE